MDYDVARAIAILREVHKRMKRIRGADVHGREHPAMADLELSGTRTGAVEITRQPKRRRRKAA